MRITDRASLIIAGAISIGTIIGVVGLSGVKKNAKSQADFFEGGPDPRKSSNL